MHADEATSNFKIVNHCILHSYKSWLECRLYRIKLTRSRIRIRNGICGDLTINSLINSQARASKKINVMQNITFINFNYKPSMPLCVYSIMDCMG